MAAILPIPPIGTPFVNPSTGSVDLVWKNYLLSLETALTVDVAPKDATYWVSRAHADLSNETNLGVLSTGYLFLTTALAVGTPSTVTAIPGGDITGAALTRTNDTNVTLTLGGTPATSLLRAASLTLGWTGTLGLARGGTAADLSGTGGASQVLKQTSSGGAVTVAQLATTDISGLASGTYTPTLTNVANLTASTAYTCQYLRVGTTVTVSGKVDVDPTTTLTPTQLGISLPVASNFAAAENCGGTAFASAIAGQGAAIVADAANDRAEMQWGAVDVTNQPMSFAFTYRVI